MNNHRSFCSYLTWRHLIGRIMLSDQMNNSWDTVTWQSCFVVIGCTVFKCLVPLFWIAFPLLTHLRDSNVVQFQQSLFTAKVSYRTVIGYSATTIFLQSDRACSNEKRIKKTETAKQSSSGVATGEGGAECHSWQRKKCQKSGKRGKNQEKSGKKRKNREEKAKIGKVRSLWPSWQIGLATLLHIGLPSPADFWKRVHRTLREVACMKSKEPIHRPI